MSSLPFSAHNHRNEKKSRQHCLKTKAKSMIQQYINGYKVVLNPATKQGSSGCLTICLKVLFRRLQCWVRISLRSNTPLKVPPPQILVPCVCSWAMARHYMCHVATKTCVSSYHAHTYTQNENLRKAVHFAEFQEYIITSNFMACII